jgi:protease-4
MKKRPFLPALLIFGALILFFFVGTLVFSSSRGSRLLSFGSKVGVVEVAGEIDSSRETIEDILNFKEDTSIKAVVLRIDSPGGGVGPSQEIHEEVKKLAEVKPVVASMGSVAASGGYYMAVPAKKIFANAGTLTGSIGVIMEFTSYQVLLEKVGLKSQVVKSGEHKDIGSPTRPMSENDRKILQSVIDDVHRQFVTAVAEGRKMKPDVVQKLADGRIFTGRQALELGLVDSLGNLQDSIDAAANLAGIVGEPRIVYPSRDEPGFLDYLIQESVSYFKRGLHGRTRHGLQFLWSEVY